MESHPYFKYLDRLNDLRARITELPDQQDFSSDKEHAQRKIDAIVRKVDEAHNALSDLRTEKYRVRTRLQYLGGNIRGLNQLANERGIERGDVRVLADNADSIYHEIEDEL